MPPDTSNTSPVRPKRGEIWYVDMDPSRGREMQKIRPCIVRVDAVPSTGMDKTSGADLFQARGVDLERFSARGPTGEVSDEVLQQIVEALAFMIGYPSETEIG